MTIAAALNRAGKTTGKGNSWTRSRVSSLRNDHAITVYREGERTERGEATLDEAAKALAVSPSTVRRLIAEDVLAARQSCKGGPWVIQTLIFGSTQWSAHRAAPKACARFRRLKFSRRCPLTFNDMAR